jgi:phage tail-like protein
MNTQPLAVSHDASETVCYAGQPVALLTAITLNEPASGFALVLSVPSCLRIDASLAWQDLGGEQVPCLGDEELHLRSDDWGHALTWQVVGDFPAGAQFRFRVETIAAAVTPDQTATSEAHVALWPPDTGERSPAGADRCSAVANASLTVRALSPLSLVADRGGCYPGEMVSFFSRVAAPQALDGFELAVYLPPGLAYAGYQAPEDLAAGAPSISLRGDGSCWLQWQVEGPIPSGASHEFQVQARVGRLDEHRDEMRVCRAELTLSPVAQTAAETAPQGSFCESTALLAVTRTAYLSYLPALYESDDLMGRFLRLFESFWLPIEQQISDFPYYFDPLTAPADLLPWLASWVGAVPDGRWSQPALRRLVRSSVSLCGRRGTRQALAESIQILTGQAMAVEIREDETNSFDVELNLPAGAGEADVERAQAIANLVRAQAPAQTNHRLL